MNSPRGPSLTVPGKIFIFGEYSILEGSKAILAAVKPGHTYLRDLESTFEPHPESPLGRWKSEHPRASKAAGGIRPWYGSLPVKTGAGLGSSTAELVAAVKWSDRQQLEMQMSQSMLAWYRNAFPRQSGADLAVQWQATSEGYGLYQVDGAKAGRLEVSRLKVGKSAEHIWVLQAPDSKKIPTHENLKSHHAVNFDLERCERFVQRLKNLLEGDAMTPEWAILSEWAQWLGSLGLESEFGTRARVAIESLPGVVGVKGCGAGLNDVFLVAADSSVNGSHFTPELALVCRELGLRLLGTLADLTSNETCVSAFAPVNIAWIKYMGKQEGKPTNPSFSITLDEVGTLTTIEVETQNVAEKGELKIEWASLGYVPPPVGQQKVERWMRNERLWLELLNGLGFDLEWPKARVRITSFNSAPAGTGIATSASGFAALAFAWSAILVQKSRREEWMRLSDPSVRARLAHVASQGSGSAGRSIDGPWVEWDREQKFIRLGGDLGPSDSRSASDWLAADWVDTDWVDLILLLDQKQKAVSSSEAHARVQSSPLLATRLKKLPQRIQNWQEAHVQKNISRVRELILDEALEMHELFHTSVPPFGYLTDESKKWIAIARSAEASVAAHALPSSEFVVTIDAGANLHWFVRPRDLKWWRTWFKDKDSQLKWIEGRVGAGARYV